MAEQCANPLLLGWLKEWMDEAQERNSKGYTVYKKAYQSMKACPLTFEHPAEAQQLNGLGPKLCDRLAEKLRIYCNQNGLPMPEKAGPRSKRQASDVDNGATTQPRKARKTQLYVPKLRSGAYALLMVLADLDCEGNQALSKADLIERAQPLCDASFTAPTDPTKFYTAWQSMKTLESKELVCTKGHPTKRYYLSDDGWEVAQKMKAAENGAQSSSNKRPTVKPTLNRQAIPRQQSSGPLDVLDLEEDSLTSDEEDNALRTKRMDHGENNVRASSTLPRRDPVSSEHIMLRPGTFEIQLVLDNREVRTKNDRDYLSKELCKLGVVPIIRALPLGDVLWIAKIKESHQSDFMRQNPGDEEAGSTEVVLDYVIERKRLDDLIGSIKDGRFHEQKFRLRKSGLQRITYLIEDYSISAERSEKYGEAVESAIAAMQVVNDIFVKQTSKIDNTIQYLTRMTKSLQSMYEGRTLHVIPSETLDVTNYLSSLEKLREAEPEKTFCITFAAFSSLCDKTDSMTLRDVYLKMLMCTRGVTGDKAVEIQKLWSTPHALIEAYDDLGNDCKKKESMISDKLGNTIPRKKIARALSAKIAEVWAT